MTELTIQQAVRNAVEAERAAARFYRALTVLEIEPEVRAFFEEMADQEDQHAAVIEQSGKRLIDGDLAEKADSDVHRIEAAPEWLVADTIEASDAVQMALQNEYKASMYYDAIADYCPEPEAEFFRKLALTELEHAKKLQTLSL